MDAPPWSELRARIDSPRLGAPFDLWYRLPRDMQPLIREDRGDPFLALCLPLAMRLGEPLEIGSPVSGRLLRAVVALGDVYRRFDPNLTRVSVRAPIAGARAEARAGAPAVGLFFSLGVDSFYSLLKHSASDGDSGGRITHLITVRGFDIPLTSSGDALWRTVLENTERVRRESGLRAVLAETNIRRLSDGLLSWGLYHGAPMAALGLALQGGLERAYIPSGASYARLHPWGTSPLLDPLWSSESIEFVHDGCEANRVAKVAAIKGSRLAMETLRVCFRAEGDAYNCGRCEKCVRTLICLQAAGALGDCRTLPARLDLDRLRGLVGTDPATVARYEEILGSLGASPGELAVREAVQRDVAMAYARLARAAFARTRAGARLDRLMTPPWRLLRRARGLFRRWRWAVRG